MLVISLILFFTILLLYQLYIYLYPTREGLENGGDGSQCVGIQLNDLGTRVSSLETKIDGLNIDDIEKKILDISSDVSILMEQSKAQYSDLQNQTEDINGMTTDTPGDLTNNFDISEEETPDDTENINDIGPTSQETISQETIAQDTTQEPNQNTKNALDLGNSTGIGINW